MARIETYGNDNKVTGFDKVIGTDVDSNRMTKNYLMRDIREYILDGASPDVGGKLKITNVAQDTPIPGTEAPEVLLNNLDPILEISKYEVLVVSLAFNDSNNEGVLTNNVYLFNQTDIIVGFQQYESTSADFILLSSSTDNSNLLTNIGTGDDVYKGFNSNTNKHEFKRIISENLTLEERGDDLYIDYVLPDLGGVKDFFVNNNYTGVEEGSLVKPYSSIDNAVQAYIGDGTIISPDNEGSRIVVQTSSVPYYFTSQLNINKLLFEIQSDASIYYEGDADYMIDTRLLNILRDGNEDANLSVSLYGEGAIQLNNKGFAYCEGTDADAVSDFRYTIVNVYGDLEIRQIYQLSEEYVSPLPITQGGNVDEEPITSGGVVNQYWQGNSLELPMIVCDKDNGIPVNLYFRESVLIRLSTQVAIHIKNKGALSGATLGDGVLKIRNFSSNYHVYKELDSSVSNGDSIKLIANEDFSYIRMEGKSTFSAGELNCSYGGGFFNYGANSGGFVLDSVVKLIESSDAKTFVISGGTFSDLTECDSVFKVEDKNVYIVVRRALFESVYTCINYLGEDGDLTELILENSILNGDIKNIDLTRGNNISVQNKINGAITMSLRKINNRTSAVNALDSGALFFNIETDTIDIVP